MATLDVDMGDDSSPEKKENKFPKNRSSPLNKSLSRASKTGAQQSPQAKKMRKLFFKFILFFTLSLTFPFFNYNHTFLNCSPFFAKVRLPYILSA